METSRFNSECRYCTSCRRSEEILNEVFDEHATNNILPFIHCEKMYGYEKSMKPYQREMIVKQSISKYIVHYIILALT